MRRAQEEAEFRAYAARPDVLDAIPARIAPQIFGAERIKEAVACLLFGGSRKVGGGPPLAAMHALCGSLEQPLSVDQNCLHRHSSQQTTCLRGACCLRPWAVHC